MTSASRRTAAAPILWCVLSAALFGASTPFAKRLLDHDLGPFTLSGLFYLGAALGVAPFAGRGGSATARAARGNRLRLGVAVVVGGTLGPVLLLLGLARTSASTVALWLNLETVFTAAFARLFFGESLGPRGAVGVALVLAAALLLAAPAGTPELAALLTPGVWLVAGACACWGLDNNLVATVDGFTPAQSTALKGLVAGGVNLGLGLAIEGAPSSAGDVLLSLVVGALAYGASIVLYVAGSHQLGATRSQAIFSTAPAWGVALSFALLGEAITPVTLVAGIAMLVAIALVHSDVHAHPHTHEPLVHTHWHRHDDDHHDHPHEGPVPRGTWHQHEHTHAAVTHDHAHRPDLHHRH